MAPDPHRSADRRLPPPVAESEESAHVARRVVLVAAAAAALLRFPGLLWPARPDEAGFLLVARGWQSAPGSLYGTYWVDRPPQLLLVFRGLDAVGGVTALRVVGALACVALVIAAAGCVRLVAGERAAAWTAVVTAALVGSSLIDAVAAKGELLALPLVMGCCWLALLALRRDQVLLAGAAGLCGGLALGMKQNLVGGLVFGGTLLLVAALRGRLRPRRSLQLAGAAAAGAMLPVLVTLAWVVASGVGVSTLWFTVYGFRSEAFTVLSQSASAAPQARLLLMLGFAFGTGMVLILAGFLRHVVDEWRDDAALTAAICAMVAVDLAALWLSGSYWGAYLFVLVPSTALCAGMLARRRSKRGLAMKVLVVGSVVSALVSAVVWVMLHVDGPQLPREAALGRAVAEVARPGDTLTVFGGRPDIQLASGMDSPYEHLWSLPMRTLDPEYVDLRAVLAGPQAPTWLVERAWFGAWQNPAGRELWTTVREHYVEVGSVCEEQGRVWVRTDVDREDPRLDCESLRGLARRG